MALLAKHIPECHREALGRPLGDAELLQPLGELSLAHPGRGDSAEVTLHIGEEHRHPGSAEPLGEYAQGDRLAGPRCAGDETMPIGHRGQEVERACRRGSNLNGWCHGGAAFVRPGSLYPDRTQDSTPQWGPPRPRAELTVSRGRAHRCVDMPGDRAQESIGGVGPEYRAEYPVPRHNLSESHEP